MVTPPKWLAYFMYVPSPLLQAVSRETQFGSLCPYLLSSSGSVLLTPLYLEGLDFPEAQSKTGFQIPNF